MSKRPKNLGSHSLKKSHRFLDLSAKNNTVDVVSQFKLLGVIISSDQTWNSHIDYICSKASKRLYSIRILKSFGNTHSWSGSNLLYIRPTHFRICLSGLALLSNWKVVKQDWTNTKKSSKDHPSQFVIPQWETRVPETRYTSRPKTTTWL